MSFLESIAEFHENHAVVKYFLVPFLGCAIVYFVFKKRREFSRHAMTNTAASILIFWANLGMIALFYQDISAALMKVYEVFNVPSVDATFWDGVPLWVTCLIGIVLKDFIYYWLHRIQHTKWGWPIHAAHHSDTHVNAFSAYRIHFLEYVMKVSAYFLLLTWLQIPEAIPIVIVLDALHDKYLHMDLPFTHGPLRHIIASPAFHRWHHADVPDAYGKNLANIIPLWDHLFGTHYTYEVVPDDVPMGALNSGIEDKNPFLILVYPVLEWSRLIRTSLATKRADDEKPARSIPAE